MPRMTTLGRLFLRGLAAILPLTLTGYLVYVSVVAGETLLHGGLDWMSRQFHFDYVYWPGMGFALSVLLVSGVGLLTYSFLIRAVYQKLTSMLRRIPVVKSVYGMIVDVVQLFGGEERPLQRVVLVKGDGGREQLGFLTREDFTDMPGFERDRVAVFLPMSYQMGGFTVLVPRSQVREVPMKAEDALRFCVTAGVMKEPQ